MKTFTDEEVFAALVSQVSSNPSGCSAIDVLTGLGLYGAASEALGRLLAAGKIKQTSPGNFLPK